MDIYQWVSIVLILSRVIIFFWIMFVTIKRFVTELKQYFFDVFKLAQYSFAFLFLTVVQIFYIGALLNASNEFLIVMHYFYFTLLNYYFLNQLVGFVMITHFLNYKMYRSGEKSYSEIKTRIKRKECVYLICIVVFFILSILLSSLTLFGTFGL